MPRRREGDGGDCEDVETSAYEKREGDSAEEFARPEVWMGFFGDFGNGLESSEEVRDDLQSQEDRNEGRKPECWMDVCWRSVAEAEKGRDDEEDDYGRCDPSLENGARTDAAIVEEGDDQRERDAQREAHEKDGLTGDAVEFERIQAREKIGCEFADGNSFPRADDEVGEQHDPAGEKADKRRKNLGGVGGFAGSVGETLDPFAIDVTNRKKNQATEGKGKNCAEWTAPAEPVVHKDEPTNANDGAETESEIVVKAELAGKRGHVDCGPDCSREMEMSPQEAASHRV